MRALADAAAVTVVDKTAIEDRVDDRVDGVLHHAITEGRGADLALFRLINKEPPVGGYMERSFTQLTM